MFIVNKFVQSLLHANIAINLLGYQYQLLNQYQLGCKVELVTCRCFECANDNHLQCVRCPLDSNFEQENKRSCGREDTSRTEDDCLGRSRNVCKANIHLLATAKQPEKWIVIFENEIKTITRYHHCHKVCCNSGRILTY